MSIEHRPYSNAIEPRGLSYWIGRMLFLVIVGYAGLIVTYAVVVISFSKPIATLPTNLQVSNTAILEAVATEAVRSSLSPWWKSAPYPDGVVMARIQARQPEVNTLMLHALISAITFSVLGFVAGRMMFSNSTLLLPACLFFATFGFLKSDLFPLLRIDLISVAVVLAVQVACVYGFALWGKWSYSG